MELGSSNEGLLHLGALAVVVTAGYLGVDRLHFGRERFRERLALIKHHVRGMLDILLDGRPPKSDFNLVGQKVEYIELSAVFKRKEILLLCYVARLTEKKLCPWMRLKYWTYSFYQLPFLNYFERGRDRIWVGGLCAASTVAFIALSLHPHWLDQLRAALRPYPHVSFIFAVTAAWALFSVALLSVMITAGSASTRLFKLKEIVEAALHEAEKRIEDKLSQDLSRRMSNLRKFRIAHMIENNGE